MARCDARVDMSFDRRSVYTFESSTENIKHVIVGVRGHLTAGPSDAVARVGQTVEFRCKTDINDVPIDFEHRGLSTSTAAGEVVKLVTGGTINEGLNAVKYKLEQNVSSILTIANVSVADSGLYSCIDDAGLGNRASAELIVLGELTTMLS